MRNLQEIMVECIKKLKDIDIPVQNDKIAEVCFSRIKGLGRCIKTIDDKYYIRISTIYKNQDIDMNFMPQYAMNCSTHAKIA